MRQLQMNPSNTPSKELRSTSKIKKRLIPSAALFANPLSMTQESAISAIRYTATYV